MPSFVVAMKNRTITQFRQLMMILARTGRKSDDKNLL
nr:MAG TPA: hypothetical protein [Caudoviricetes sp.]